MVSEKNKGGEGNRLHLVSCALNGQGHVLYLDYDQNQREWTRVEEKAGKEGGGR